MNEMVKVGGLELVSKELTNGANKVVKPTFKAVKEQIKAMNPDLPSAKVKALAEKAMSDLSGKFDSYAIAAISEAGKRGFNVESITSTTLKSGKEKFQVVSAKPAPKAEKAKTKAELLKEMEALKAQLAAVQSATIEG